MNDTAKSALLGAHLAATLATVMLALLSSSQRLNAFSRRNRFEKDQSSRVFDLVSAFWREAFCVGITLVAVWA